MGAVRCAKAAGAARRFPKAPVQYAKALARWTNTSIVPTVPVRAGQTDFHSGVEKESPVMPIECERCAGIDVEHVAELDVIGGCDFKVPGELRRCRGCGAYFTYYHDHDNEIGYVATPPSVERLDNNRALKVAKDALVAAQSSFDYFAARDDAYSKNAAGGYAAEIIRLRAVAG